MTERVSVMIVDDQAPFRDAARAVLGRVDGFDLVAEVESGEDAVSTSEQLASRPRVDGHQHGCAERHRRHPPDRRRPPGDQVILVSTYALDDLPPGARTSGAMAYVNKDELSPRVVRRLWEAGGDPDWIT